MQCNLHIENIDNFSFKLNNTICIYIYNKHAALIFLFASYTYNVIFICISILHALLGIIDKVRDKTNLPRHESKHK